MFGLIGSLLGFASSGLPAVLDHFKQKSQQKHELALMEMAAKHKITVAKAKADEAEISGVYQHSQTIQNNASKWIVNLSGLVRPTVTFAILGLYLTAKTLAVVQVYQNGGDLHEFLPEIYSETDVGILSSVVCFWFSSRAIEKMRK